MKKVSKKVTLEEVLFAVNEGFTGVEGRLQGVEGRLLGVEKQVKALGSRVNTLESQMVTKEYLDNKLMILKGDIITSLRHEDIKLVTLVEKLEAKKILTSSDAQEILTLEPFPRLRAQLV